MSDEPPEPPACPCGAAMRFDAQTGTWACPRTLDESGWGRPKKGHTHYYPAEDLAAGRAPLKS